MLFAGTGDADYLRWANICARHLMDVDQVHPSGKMHYHGYTASGDYHEEPDAIDMQGHPYIAGIVNPPGPKAWYEAADYAGLHPEAWRQANSKHRGSWWEDWTTWADDRAGERIKPPAMGSRRHRAIGDAPGEYVFG